MSSTIIESRGLGKRYRLGVLGHETETFRELLMRLARGPFRRRKQIADAPAGVDHIWALKDIDFDVQEGSVVGIIGRNGAGKSTLLKLLSRITQPTAGQVTIRGRLACLLEVGTGFHPELTGRENIFLNGAILGMRRTEIRAKFDEIVAFSEIAQFLDTPVKRYSSGMYVRLAFAVAAHLDPEILVVDEVLAVGDVAFQRKCLGKMSQVSRGGRTVLFVSHNMAAVESLCESAMVLSGGKKVFDGGVGPAIDFYLAAVADHPDGTEGHATNLENAPGRTTANGAVFKRLELLNNDGQPITGGVPLGSGLTVALDFEVDRLVGHFDVCVWFQTLYGQTVLTTSTLFEPEHPVLERAGEQRLELAIPRVTLMPNDYSLKLELKLGSTIVDVIDDAARVSVLPSNFYGSGKLPTTGNYVLEQRWTLR